MPEEITVPEHYKLLAKEIKPLIKEIQDAFINRPLPQGLPYPDLESLNPLMDRTASAVQRSTKAINNIRGCVSFDEKDVSNEEVKMTFLDVKIEVREIISIFHEVWKRPFSSGLLDGQPIFSAIFERILRDLLSIFEKAIDIVERPEDVIKKYGSYKVKLDLILNDREVKRFLEWLDDKKITLKTSNYISGKRYGFSSLLAAFLLGWWIGDED